MGRRPCRGRYSGFAASVSECDRGLEAARQLNAGTWLAGHHWLKLHAMGPASSASGSRGIHRSLTWRNVAQGEFVRDKKDFTCIEQADTCRYCFASQHGLCT